MNCPICKDRTLQPVFPKEGLPAQRCPQCGGLWLSSQPYLDWVRRQGPPLPEKSDDLESQPVEPKVPKLCPECGHLLFRYKVLPRVEFYLDHCGHCNGVWFERGEWETLESHNFHDKVNLFFTRAWQRKVQAEEQRQVQEMLYLEKLGAEDYARIKEVRVWLDAHPRRAMLLAFLQAEDPYKVSR
jgi:Zn-finger nucleic acid-binding protein